MIVFLALIVYLAIAAFLVFVFYVGFVKYTDFDPDIDIPFGPFVSGIFWPILGPVYAAYLAARWYLKNNRED